MKGNQEHFLILDNFHRIMVNSTAIWLNMLDNNAKVVMWNKAAEKISGYSREEVLGRDDIWEWLYPDKEYRRSVHSEALEIINQGKELIDFETIIQSRNGEQRRLSWNSHDVKDADGNTIGSLAIARDITELHASQKQLEDLASELEKSNRHLRYLSEMDELTGLHNRRHMEAALGEEWERHVSQGLSLSLVYIDIDYFKEYNDTYGHDAGDQALVEIARLFRHSALRSGDQIARYGGEEFLLLLPETPHEDAKKIAGRLHQAVMDRKIEHRGSRICHFLTVSIGVATIRPSRSETVGRLKREADALLYCAKRHGRNRIEAAEIE